MNILSRSFRLFCVLHFMVQFLNHLKYELHLNSIYSFCSCLTDRIAHPLRRPINILYIYIYMFAIYFESDASQYKHCADRLRILILKQMI